MKSWGGQKKYLFVYFFFLTMMVTMEVFYAMEIEGNRMNVHFQKNNLWQRMNVVQNVL